MPDCEQKAHGSESRGEGPIHLTLSLDPHWSTGEEDSSNP